MATANTWRSPGSLDEKVGEKEEAEIVNGSEKAMKNETVVVQGPLGVSMVRTYAQHR